MKLASASIGLVAAAFVIACGSDSSEGAPSPAASSPEAGVQNAPDTGATRPDDGTAPTGPLDLRLVFVHGVVSEDEQRMHAERALTDLEHDVAAAIEARRPAFEACGNRVEGCLAHRA